VTVISLLGLLLACPTDSSGSSGSTGSVNQTPKFSDYNISGTGNFVAGGEPAFVKVEITANAGASTGGITIYYALDGKEANKTTTVPSPNDVGVYNVTFDVEASTGWNPGKGLAAGFVNIANGDFDLPLREHFTVTGFPQTFQVGDAPKAVSITAASDKTKGTITIVYTDGDGKITTGSATGGNFPTAVGTYTVSFNVAEDAAGKWRAVNGFSAGTVTITKKDDLTEPVKVVKLEAADFYITIGKDNPERRDLTSETEDSFDINFKNADLPVILKVKSGAMDNDYPIGDDSTIIQYWLDGITGTMVGAPKNVGVYTIFITLEPVVLVEQRKAWSGLKLEIELNVKARKPTAADYDITKTVQSEFGIFLGNTITPEHVSIKAKKEFAGSLPEPTGTALETTSKIYYEGISPTVYAKSGLVPKAAGRYKVTFDIPAIGGASNNPIAAGSGNNWLGDLGIEAGVLELQSLQPVKPEVDTKFWVDKDTDVLKVTDRELYILPTDTKTFTLELGALKPSVVEWSEDGFATGNSTLTYTFGKNSPNPTTSIGWHWVTLTVKTDDVMKIGDDGKVVVGSDGKEVVDKPGKYYSETVYIRIQTPQQ